MNEIKIIEEIKNRLWKLTETEYSMLENSIITDGCREPLILWKDIFDCGTILVDGHNRYEICTKNNIEYKIIYKDFNDLDDVMEWVDMNQLMRRNLLDWQRDILLGRLSRDKKRKITNESGSNQYKKVVSGQNVHQPESQISVAEKAGVNLRTVYRAEKFLDSFEKIEKIIGKDEVTKLANETSKEALTKIGKMLPDDIKKVIEKNNSDKKYKSITSVIKEVEKENHIDVRKNEINLSINKKVKIFNDDCRNILKNIKDESIDLVLTDPPYGIDFKSSWNGKDKTEFVDDIINTTELLTDVCKLLQSKCKRNAHLYFFTSWMMYSKFEKIISNYFDISNVLVWVKNNNSLVDFDKRYGFKYEQIIFCKQKGNNERMLNGKSSPDVLEYNRVNNPDHPCEKPVDLLEYIIRNSTIENELVIDPFAGTFNSMVASVQSGRKYIGIEKNKEFFEIGKNKNSNNDL